MERRINDALTLINQLEVSTRPTRAIPPPPLPSGDSRRFSEILCHFPRSKIPYNSQGGGGLFIYLFEDLCRLFATDGA